MAVSVYTQCLRENISDKERRTDLPVSPAAMATVKSDKSISFHSQRYAPRQFQLAPSRSAACQVPSKPHYISILSITVNRAESECLAFLCRARCLLLSINWPGCWSNNPEGQRRKNKQWIPRHSLSERASSTHNIV